MSCRAGDRCKQHKVPDHGTRQRYVSRTHGCRCADCRQANTDYCNPVKASPTKTVQTKAIRFVPMGPLSDGLQHPEGWGDAPWRGLKVAS